MHAVAPSPAWYVPSSHDVHCWLPVVLAYEPLLQGRGCAVGKPPPHQLPAWQSMHASAVALKKVPTAHIVAICMTLPASHV